MTTRQLCKLLCAIGILTGLVGIGTMSYDCYKLLTYEKTTGVITAIQTSRGNPGNPGKITFQYITKNGEPMTIHTKIGIKGAQRGQSLTIYYNPSSPKQASMYTFTTFWLVPIIAFGFTIFLGGIGTYGLKHNPV